MMLRTPSIPIAGGIPQVGDLAAAIAYAEAREGLGSLVALVSARGGLVTTIWNRGTVAVPAIERLSPWEWREASFGPYSASFPARYSREYSSFQEITFSSLRYAFLIALAAATGFFMPVPVVTNECASSHVFRCSSIAFAQRLS